MKILISTGIYPPKIGGPAEYSKNLKINLENFQNVLSVVTFGFEGYMPTGLRHFWFFMKVLHKVVFSDFVIIMDTFSVGLPTVIACKLFGKKNIIRTGGDFLWEQFVERTGKKVLFRNFYDEEKGNFSNKEKIIFKLTKWTLQNTSNVVFSTKWQRDLFVRVYELSEDKTHIIENFYGEKEESFEPAHKNFVASTRNLIWKNQDVLKKVFKNLQEKNKDIELFTENLNYESFVNKIKNSYAVILVSLGDISPNMILDAIRLNKPIICTKEIGIYDRIKDVGIFVDPLNEEEIESAVNNLLDPKEYERALQKVKNFTFTHSWKEVSEEFLKVYDSIK